MKTLASLSASSDISISIFPKKEITLVFFPSFLLAIFFTMSGILFCCDSSKFNAISIGLIDKSWYVFSRCISSFVNSFSRNGFSLSSICLHFSSTGNSRFASSSCIFMSCFLIRSIRVSTRARSESINSVSNDSISRIASMDPSGCGTVSFENNLTTCIRASFVLTFDKKFVVN